MLQAAELHTHTQAKSASFGRDVRGVRRNAGRKAMRHQHAANGRKGAGPAPSHHCPSVAFIDSNITCQRRLKAFPSGEQSEAKMQNQRKDEPFARA